MATKTKKQTSTTLINVAQPAPKKKPTQAAVGVAVAEYAQLKEQEAVLKRKLEQAADALKNLLSVSEIDEATVYHGGLVYEVTYKQGAAYPGKLVTQDMVGTMVGAKAGSRPLVVKRLGVSEEAA